MKLPPIFVVWDPTLMQKNFLLLHHFGWDFPLKELRRSLGWCHRNHPLYDEDLSPWNCWMAILAISSWSRGTQ